MTEKFSSTEQRIMRLLYQVKAPMTAYEVAKKIGVSFPTAKHYLEKLADKGILIEDEDDGTFKKN